MTSQYQTMEIEWKPALDDNGNQILAKDKTPIVNSDPLVLTPSYQGQYGGFAFQGVDGIWSLPMGSPANALEIGIPVLVVLSLGGFKSISAVSSQQVIMSQLLAVRYQIHQIACPQRASRTHKKPQTSKGLLLHRSRQIQGLLYGNKCTLRAYVPFHRRYSEHCQQIGKLQC